ncbi:hypothetical protein EG329_003416 [Mollisiaceae sp. DMI_Dod_QoI]|nr:hypothetical protein EG329_003416 [Helotiales sp. DMI_Dod_QoI]
MAKALPEGRKSPAPNEKQSVRTKEAPVEPAENEPSEELVETQVAGSEDEIEEMTAEMDDLGMEDWCLVESADVDAVTEGEATKKATGRSYRFW